MEVDTALAWRMKLVSISSKSHTKPLGPVVRIMDYGQVQVRDGQQARAAKKKQHVIELRR